MSREKQKFITQAYIQLCAAGRVPSDALNEASDLWEHLTKNRPSERRTLSSAEIKRQILEALAKDQVKTVPGGMRLREALSARIREKYGKAPGTNRLQEAIQELKELEFVYMPPDRRTLM